jgi:hypothetical protein
MKRFVEGTDRGQSTLFPECLDDWIDENNPVRVIDAFVDTLDLGALDFEGVVPAETGRNLKGDLAIRPVFHQLEARIEAHVFIAFLAYCLHVTLARRLHALAPGLTPRSMLEKFAAMQMIDVHLPTTDGRELVLTRYTEPEPELSLLLNKLKLELPAQPPPKITPAPAAP